MGVGNTFSRGSIVVKSHFTHSKLINPPLCWKCNRKNVKYQTPRAHCPPENTMLAEALPEFEACRCTFWEASLSLNWYPDAERLSVASKFSFCRRLVPTSIPDTCVVDPVRRRTPLPSLGTCVAPILEAGSLGKRRIPRVCSNSKFRASLLGKEWTLDRFDPINYVISTRRSKGNSKRATTSKMSKISHQRLREIYLERLSRFPFIGPDGTDITVTI